MVYTAMYKEAGRGIVFWRICIWRPVWVRRNNEEKFTLYVAKRKNWNHI
jgi:hypothetical protein